MSRELSREEASRRWGGGPGTPRLEGRLPPERMYPGAHGDFRTRFFETPSSAVVRVVERGPSSGAPVVCVHGWGASVYTFRSTIPALAAAGYRVFAIDLKGHGLSAKPMDVGAYTLAAMSRHVVELLDALELGRAPLVGHSMGGAVCFDIALALPARVERLVLMAPVGFGRVNGSALGKLLPPPLMDPVLPYVVPRTALQMTLRFVHSRSAGKQVSDEDVDQYWAPTQFAEFTQALLRLVREFDWQPAAPDRLRRLTVPALVLVGSEDRLVDFTSASSLVAQLPGARLERIDGAGHVVPEDGGERVSAMVAEFLGH